MSESTEVADERRARAPARQDDGREPERAPDETATEAGKKKYARRAAIVEPVFAWIKHVRGIRSFLLRGLDAVRNEWRIICLTQNLLKLQRYRGANATS